MTNIAVKVLAWKWTPYIGAALLGLVVYAVADTVLKARDAAHDSTRALHQLKVEGAERRDESCTFFERQHVTSVEQLASTYTYVASLRPEELKTTLNQFVIKSLPVTEARAVSDTPPDYCFIKGVGLKDQYGEDIPKPMIPQRPKAVQNATSG